MKLLITQIRILCKGNEKEENDEVDKLVATLCKNIQELYKEKEFLQNSLEDS